MKKLALALAAAATVALFAAAPASAQGMHRDGMHRGPAAHHGMRRMPPRMFHPHRRPMRRHMH